MVARNVTVSHSLRLRVYCAGNAKFIVLSLARRRRLKLNLIIGPDGQACQARTQVDSEPGSSRLLVTGKGRVGESKTILIANESFNLAQCWAVLRH